MKHQNQPKKEEKLKEAAALQYSPDNDSAPRVTALGKGKTAEKILDAAKESGVPVYEDANLVHMLNQLDLGDEIPTELYGLVAEILAFVSTLDRKYGEQDGE